MSASVALRPLGYASTYNDLHTIMRERAEELLVSRLELDDIAGLQSGYSAKLLARSKIKTMGPMSMIALLGALGLGLVVVEDPVATEKTLKRAALPRHVAKRRAARAASLRRLT